MKILIINTEIFRGGAAQIALRLYHALNESAEISSYFLYGKGPRVSNRKAFRFTWGPEVYLHAFLTRVTGLQGYGTLVSTKRLVDFIVREKFDVIHLHNLHGYYLDLSFVQSLGKLGIPIVWTLHDGWPITGRCAYLSECNSWKIGCGNCPNLSWYPKTYFDSSAFMWKKKKEYFNSGWKPIIVCPSQWLADRVKESYLNKFKIEVIPNGVDTEIFKPKDKIEIRKKLKIALSKKVILSVAANLRDERKGAKYFFEALQHIKTNNWMILTMGKKINLNREVKAKVDIKQLGYISDKNLISDIYNATDVFCSTSLDEVFGLTATESMACGTPVVGFKVGGIPEQVTEDCGILVSPRDEKALGRAIEHLLTDDKMRQEMSLNCRKRAEQKYNIEKFTKRYIQVYRELIK
mgnify:CR=1 FL=1